MIRIFFQMFVFLIVFGATPYCVFSQNVVHKDDVSPFKFGLATAKTGIERYYVLLRVHQAAINEGVNVNYSGIDTIKLEIPVNAEEIPLTSYNDFKGCVFVIKNTQKHLYLFRFEKAGVNIDVDKRSIDAGDFSKFNELNHSRMLLLIEDENPWVDNRRGYPYGHTRRDILLIENGKASNSVVMPYNNEYSQPRCNYIPLNNDPLIIKNLSIKREADCTYVTHVFKVSGYDDVRISNVSICTPENTLHGDHAISINDCTNVSLDNIHIDGTYSHEKGYGYGISLNNVWNFKAKKLYGNGKWGIFGNNNVNTACIEDSKINRFDIHCYGRDITFKDVDFFNLYNQYASVFGTILYKNCSFTDFIPVLNGGSYNSFVAHRVIMKDCVFNASPGKNVLFKFSRLNENPNMRNELSEKCLPNVIIKRLNINLKDGVDVFYLFWSSASGDYVSDIGGISDIQVDGVTINQDRNKPFKAIILSNIGIKANQPIICGISDVVLNGAEMRTKASNSRKFIQLKTNMNIRGGLVNLKDASILKQ